MRLLVGKYLLHGWLFGFFCIGLSPVALAHNVVSGVYADGMMIEGEIGFSNGEMAPAGKPVKVFDAEGDLLAELMTKAGGVFFYEAKARAKHTFKADLSAGHIAEMVIEVDELMLPATMTEQTLAQNSEALGNHSNNNVSVQQYSADVALDSTISVVQLESIVRSAVAQQIRPLQKELRAYKEKVMFRDIAGGLGFIFGLFGVAAWMASKRQPGEKNATVS